MTELETMQRAKMYLDKLANGINPLTDQPASDSDCINQVRISRCLFYVSDLLRKVIENGGNIGKTEKVKKQPFSISHETLNNSMIKPYIPIQRPSSFLLLACHIKQNSSLAKLSFQHVKSANLFFAHWTLVRRWIIMYAKGNQK